MTKRQPTFAVEGDPSEAFLLLDALGHLIVCYEKSPFDTKSLNYMGRGSHSKPLLHDDLVCLVISDLTMKKAMKCPNVLLVKLPCSQPICVIGSTWNRLGHAFHSGTPLLLKPFFCW